MEVWLKLLSAVDVPHHAWWLVFATLQSLVAHVEKHERRGEGALPILILILIFKSRVVPDTKSQEPRGKGKAL
jgi:hypothetical protein